MACHQATTGDRLSLHGSHVAGRPEWRVWCMPDCSHSRQKGPVSPSAHVPLRPLPPRHADDGQWSAVHEAVASGQRCAPSPGEGRQKPGCRGALPAAEQSRPAGQGGGGGEGGEGGGGG